MELSGFLRKFESLRSLSTFMLLIWSHQSLGIQVKLLLIAFLFTCATYFSMLLFCSISFPIAFILLEIIYEHRKHLIYCRRVIWALAYQRQRKRHLLNEFAFLQTLSDWFQFAENVKFPWSWFLGDRTQVLEREKISRRLFMSSIKCGIRHFHVVVVQGRKGMWKIAWCTYNVVVLLSKPSFFTFSLPSPS